MTCCPDRNNILRTRYSAARFIASCSGVGGTCGLDALFESESKASLKHKRAVTSRVEILDSSRRTTARRSESRRLRDGDGVGGVEEEGGVGEGCGGEG